MLDFDYFFLWSNSDLYMKFVLSFDLFRRLNVKIGLIKKKTHNIKKFFFKPNLGSCHSISS